MEADDLRNLVLVEMTVNRVSDLRMQVVQIVGLGEDRFSESPCGETALWGFLDEEDHFRRTGAPNW